MDLPCADIPDATRRAVLLRACFGCEDCGRCLPLELHHLRYWVEGGREAIYGHETPDDLVALCRECHKGRHIDINDDWWNDPEEMGSYWEPFWDALA